MSDLLIRLWGWERVFPCDEDKPEGSLYLEAADRIEELEAEVKKQALQYLCDAGQLGERVGELISVLEEVDAWVEGLGYYADESAELVPVFKKVKAVLGKGYK
jgi:predicted trehalose synthase